LIKLIVRNEFSGKNASDAKKLKALNDHIDEVYYGLNLLRYNKINAVI